MVTIYLPENLKSDDSQKDGGLINDVQKVTEAVKVDRRYHVESMIIKVMKKLKSCEFENMITEVLPLLRFNQQRSDVEARTE